MSEPARSGEPDTNVLVAELERLRAERIELDVRLAEMQGQAHGVIANQAKLQALLNDVPQGIVIFGADGTVQSFNRKAERLFGVAEIDVIYREIPQLFGWPEDLRAGDVPSRLRRWCANTADPDRPPLTAIRPDGTCIPIEISVSEVKSDDLVLFDDFGSDEVQASERYDLFFCICHDLRRELATRAVIEQQRARLKEAARLQRRYLRTATRDLATPLNGILPMVDLLSDLHLPERAQRYLGTVRQAGEALGRIAREMEDFAALDTGEETAGIEVFDPRLDLGELCDRHALRARTRKVLFDLRFEERVPAALRADRARILAVAGTLIDNAVRYTREGSVRVRVAWHEVTDGRCVLTLAVHDTGRGIPAALLAELGRGAPPGEADEGRKGLGLAVAHQVMETLGGALDISSVVGRGTRVTARFPAQLASAAGTVLDERMVADLRLMFGSRMRELVRTFRADASEGLQQERAAVTHGQTAALAGLAARLRESAEGVGALRLARDATQLVRATPVEAAELLAEMERGLDGVCAVLGG